MPAINGYTRISKPKQSIDRQIRNILAAYPNAKIYSEVWTGTTSNRKQWQRLMKAVRPGDTIVFDSVSRMSRNAQEGFADYERLFNAGIELVFLKEPHINTSVFRQALNKKLDLTGTKLDLILEGINRYLMAVAEEQIILAFEQSEKEVMDLRQRTKEGLITARSNGKVLGRKTGSTFETKKAKKAKEQILRLSKDFNGNLNDQDTIKIVEVSQNTYYKYKRELREALAEQVVADKNSGGEPDV